MPNDCWCDVRIGGPEDTIRYLVESEFLFDKLIPAPEHDTEFARRENSLTARPKGCDDTTEWYETNWGTRSERYDYSIGELGKEAIYFYFTCVWAPPYPIFEHLLERFQDLWICCKWREESGYAGLFVGDNKDGKKILRF